MASFQNEQGTLRSWLPTCPLGIEPAETQPGPPMKSPLRNPPSFPKPSAHSSSSRWELPRARLSGCRKCSPAADAGMMNGLGEWQQPWGTGTGSWPPDAFVLLKEWEAPLSPIKRERQQKTLEPALNGTLAQLHCSFIPLDDWRYARDRAPALKILSVWKKN